MEKMGGVLLRAVSTFLILVVVSFTMLWLGNKLNDSGMAVTRFLARAHAPLTAQLTYPQQARDQITVVMYDREFLQATGSAWPISYQDHADWLLRLTGDPSARPKAIMLDITFGQERNDPTLAALQQALCTIQNEFKVPVFLAALASPQDGQLRVRSGLEAGTPGTSSACFTLVGVDYVPDPLDGLAWSYQLSRYWDGTQWQPGRSNEAAQSFPAYRSAALSMAQDVARIDMGEETVPMALVWGFNSAPQRQRPEQRVGCRVGEFDWGMLVPGKLEKLWQNDVAPPALCPYHQTLSMAQLGQLPEDELAPYLAGRYVMVGAQVPGYNDFADSPVHGIVPGIHMHAMALDNLLTYKGDYKLSADWTLPPAWTLFWPGLSVIFVVFLVHQGWVFFINTVRVRWRWLRKKHGLSQRKASLSERLPNSLANPGYRTRQLKNFVGTAVVWIAQIWVQLAVSLLFIAVLQYSSRVGMLPVVELLAMTVVAQSLDYVDKLRCFLAGKPPASSR